MVTHDLASSWGHGVLQHLTRNATALWLAVALALMVGKDAYQVWQGTPIHYIPQGGPGFSRPGLASDTYVGQYAATWLRDRYGFTPDTIKATHVAIKQTLHPVMHADFDVQTEREAKEVKDAKMSSQVVITSTKVVQRSGGRVAVQAEGTRTIFIGGEALDPQPIHGTFVLVPWYSAGTPSGLLVYSVKVTPVVSVSGRSRR